MKVYEATGFINPIRVRIALKEKNAIDQVEFVEVDIMNGEHRQPEFKAKNPSASVPVLELDDGTTIAECSAITEYIDHKFPGVCLTGKTPTERAVIHMMQRRGEQYVLDAVGSYFHHATPGLGKNLETYQNQEWGEKQREKRSPGCTILIKFWESKISLQEPTFLWQILQCLSDLLLPTLSSLRSLANVKT